MKVLGTAVVLAALGCQGNPSSSSLKEHWDANNNPARLGIATAQYQSLPVQAELANHNTLWSGYFWPTFRGGIADRWQRGSHGVDYRSYLYAPLSPADVQNLSELDLNRLSPSEKFDLFKGRLDFPLTKAVQQRTVSRAVNGIVPGLDNMAMAWSAVVTQEAAPGTYSTVQLVDRRHLTFFASDIEALMEQTYSEPARYGVQTLGTVCDGAHYLPDDQNRPLESECRDTNPATMHLAMHDYIVQRGLPFIMNQGSDMSASNVPVYGYTFKYTNERPFDPATDPAAAFRAAGTQSLVDVQTQLLFAGNSTTSMNPRRGVTDYYTVSYTLELDAQGLIIGGEWLSSEHPDFIWEVTSRPVADPTGLVDYADARQLLDGSIGHTTLPAWPEPTPGPAPTPGSGIPADGSREARLLLNYVNVAAREVLVTRAHISPDAAYRIEATYNGPDGETGTIDDRPFIWMSQLIPLVSPYELQLLLGASHQP